MAAQYKFEVEDKLRRYYRRPGKPIDFVFALVHGDKLAGYGLDEPRSYPNLCGYCLLVRDVSRDHGDPAEIQAETPGSYLERVVAEAVDAEFRAYAALPEVVTKDLRRWFCADGPAIKEILNILTRHQKKDGLSQTL